MKLVVLLMILAASLMVSLSFLDINIPHDQNLLGTVQTSSIENPSLPTPSLNSIFSNDYKIPAGIPPEQTITMIATGDIIPARSVNFQTVTRNDFKWPYQQVSSLFSGSDFTFINLESPLIDNCPITQEGMVFCGDTRHIDGLNFINTKVANLANNHSINHGQAGIDETINLLKNNGIQVTGTSGSVLMDIKGTRFAFLGYNDVGSTGGLVSQANEDLIKQEVAQAKSQANIVVVAFHWGEEYTSQPTNRQINLAHLAADSGADLIIGNHPHWIQPVEIYHDKLIVYAHGNFIFDQMWSEKTKKGVIGQYTFYQNRLVDVKFAPILIRDYGQAIMPETNQSQDILNQMQQESQILSDHLL